MHPNIIQLIASRLECEMLAEGDAAVAAKYGVAVPTLYRVRARAANVKPSTYATLALRMGLLQPAQGLAISSVPLASDITPA